MPECDAFDNDIISQLEICLNKILEVPKYFLIINKCIQ